MSLSLFIQSAEAAFIADLSDRQMHRVVDEHLVPESLFAQRGSSRLFTRLGAAFAQFYYATEDLLIAGARKQVLEELAARVAQLPTKNEVLTLAMPNAISWKVARKAVEVDVSPYVQGACLRALEVDRADALITTDAEVLGGTPVFAGTRVPIEMVLGSLDSGLDLDTVKAAYPFLTAAHVQAAKVYQAVHPRKGRPRRLAEVNPGLACSIRRVVAA